jgi:hypothetical protein
MKRIFFVIMFLIWMGFLAGCRASKESKARNERTAESEIGVELRKADSLWSSIAERLNFKIEFYPLEYSIGNGTPTAFTGASLPAAPCSTVPAGVANPLPWQAQGVGAGGMGAAHSAAQGPALRQAQGPLAQGGIKSIEITAESGTSTGSVSAVDSTYEEKSATTETRQEEKASEARHDNGTVIGVAIVAAVAALVYFLLKQFLKP